ncbi:hypothetical protein EI94DRAFT_1799819 [Lactarius quietus]|nr:hypothetical protein EI94DRAFT_1799819 [Lactarius quietus]
MSSVSMYPERPTLPPLRSLDLPMHGVPSRMTLPGIHELCNQNNDLDPSHLTALYAWQWRRQGSVSSPTSSCFPSTPLPPSIAASFTSAHNSVPPQPHQMQRGNPSDSHVRLVLADSFDHADAALVLCSAAGATNATGAPRMISSPDALGGIKPGAPLLVVGPALERIRRPGTVLGKGVRMHPYRIVHPTNPPMSPISNTKHVPRK